MSRDISSEEDNKNIPVILCVMRPDAELEIIQQTHPTMMVISCANKAASTPKFFNTVQREYGSKDIILGFLSEYDYLTDETSISRIVEVIANGVFGAVYGDFILLKDVFRIPQTTPSVNRKNSDMIVNCPLFIKGSFMQEWNEELESAYFFDMFKKLSRSTLMYHLPNPIVSTIYHKVNGKEFEEVRKL